MNTEDAGPPIRILVCEDEPSLRADLTAVLRETGYSVMEAADGLAARDLLDAQAPDLILCDVSMPHFDGLELLAHLRALRPDLAEVPFLFLTALADREQVIAGKRAGADDYLVKPIDYEIMLATISAQLRQVARVRARLAARAAETREALGTAGSLSTFSAIDSLAPAIALLDAEGVVVHANGAAEELIDASDGLLRQRMAIEVPGAIQRAGTKPDCEKEAVFLRLPQHEDEQDVIVLLSLLPPAPAAGGPAVMALIVDPSRRAAPTDALLRNLFGLTPTEARVSSLLVQGDRLEDIARGLGIQQSTVVFHLRNIFAKTDTNRQTDLVALLLSLTVTQ
ncbi:regulatory LuxR family protein [Breoghania corrubedonensis]|uniref:Regulatory LuxR family protein n=1 Tax=Breoghania corrubedonensis TaxID=665038 RepID=A0A2T5UVZ8_9HYPH|nr:response regulator [Breoghania corrubedonensis]PTW55679.1 regulatory LuxR family protein [Breoghania corrubedonensis]